MIADFSKVPSTCEIRLMSHGNGFLCVLEETIRGRKISASGTGLTMQAAIDRAVEDFTR